MATIKEREKLDQLLKDLLIHSQREYALAEISKLREIIPEFATILWNTPCMIRF